MKLFRFKGNRQIWVGLMVLGSMIILTILSPLITRYDPNAQVEPALSRYQSPSWEHWFGTDQFGRDVFSRVLFGGRISLIIAVSVVFLSVMIGVCYGAVSGYFGGLVDQILMRFVDLFLSFPVIFLVVTCMALFGSGISLLIVVLTLTGWLDIARLIRAEVNALKQRPFILKARAAGLRTLRIIGRHLIPNVVITMIAIAVIRVADIILIETALSFIGLGVQPPTASWGSVINDGRLVLTSAWWVTLFPGMAIILTTMSLYVIGDGIKALHH